MSIEWRVPNWVKGCQPDWTEGCGGVRGCQATGEGRSRYLIGGPVTGGTDSVAVQAEAGLECVGRRQCTRLGSGKCREESLGPEISNSC